MALPEIGAWRVEVLRFTFFFNEPQSGRGGDWWKVATGFDPETVTSKPQVGEHIAVGAYLDGQLELKIVFNRIDWVLTYPFASMPDSAPGMNIEEVTRKFLPDIARWMNTLSNSVIRVAFGVVALFPVKTVSEGNSLLSSYFPFFKFDPDTATDIFLQINNPQKTNLLGGKDYNFVTKTGVVTGQFMQMALGGFPQMTTNNLFRNEFDVSTPVDRIEPLSIQDMTALLGQFIGKIVLVLKEGA